ncbi:thiamine phosphate synthase [Candidatus Venteria ishoeyi]|uniref:Thiamine-phosphate synthase n=1 Tax=Candidatus Venteria ishoeyi TaxID=1899563 RepID=A0A1H6F2N3_9GAMM|nr:thiamine phosphate synthase [Candidatus Venteria ishoeyi]SEH04417.1 Thiamine-phosphate synthase [Candidatus Venteria ishoeyi]
MNHIPLPVGGLYAITASCDNESVWLQRCEQILAGGASILQYRDKTASAVQRKQRALRLQRLCRSRQVPLLINDDLALAVEIGADGVHLGKNDPPFAVARQQLGKQAIIGVSCYNQLPLAQKAQAQGADYVAFGRFFSSTTKPEAILAPLELLTQARAQLNLPIVAIGGISVDNAMDLLTAGADFLAVIGTLFNAEKPQQVAAQLCECHLRTRSGQINVLDK